MKNRPILPIALCCGLWLVTLAFAADRPGFDEANKKYAAGDFKGALALYEKIIQAGNRTPAVYYNLGNANLRLGQKGQALLAYRRAERAIPRDKDLRWNITVLKNALQDRIEEPDENLAVFGLKKAVGFFSADEAAIVFTLFLAVLFVLAFVELLLRPVRPFVRPIRKCLGVFLIIAGFFFFVKWTQVRNACVVILDQEVSAYYGPSEKETKAFLLHEGTEARVLDESRDWVYVTLKNKSTGWIPKNSCEMV